MMTAAQRLFTCALVLSAALAGCNRADDPQPSSTSAAASAAAPTPIQNSGHSDFKVALLSPGPVSDAGWNALAYEGLLAVRDQVGAEVTQIQTKTPAEFEEGFRDFARRGFRLVFGHGFEFQEAAATVSPDFPETVFITTSGNTVRPNVAPMRFMLEEATYLEGMLAGRLSRSKKVGVIGGMEMPAVKSTVMAFEAGVKAVAPQGEVITIYTGSWEDVAAGKEAALALIRRGCDVLFHNADAAGLGVFQAAQEKRVYAFGANRNQNDVAPDVILASAVIDIPRAMVGLARQVKDHTFQAKIEKMGMKDGVVSLVLNPRLEGAIPQPYKTEIAATQAKILSGELVVPSAEF